MQEHLQELKDSLTTLLDGLSNDELNRSVPGKWSVAEVFEHLYLSYTGTTKGFSRVEEAGKPSAGRPTLKNRLQTFVVVGLGYFPRGRKSPPTALPRGLSPQKVMAEIASNVDEMDEIISRCAQKFGPDIKILDHPILGPLSANQWSKFHLVHGRHHLKQIERLRVETNPRSS